jgi:hypothetical protein
MKNFNPNVLVESLLEGVADNKKDAMRVILENEAKYANQLNEATFSGAIKTVPKLILPLARRAMTNIIADQLVGVQPLKERTGVCMTLKYVFAQEVKIDLGSTEAAEAEVARYNALVSNDPDAPLAKTEDGTAAGSVVVYPAGAEVSYVAGVAQYAQEVSTEVGEQMSFDNSNADLRFREITLKFIQTTVTARTRKLAAQWTLEAAQDAKASLGINIEEEMISALAQTIANDIDRELLNTIEKKVGYTTNYDYESISGYNSMAEKYQALYSKILEVANQIAVRTRRGAANWMVVNPNVLTVLQTLKSFNFAPNATTYVDPTNVGLAGTIEGRFKVFTDIIRTSDDVLLGYKGNTETDTGIVYMPYVPIEVSPTILDGNTFMPRVMLSTRYAIADNLLGADAYYGKVIVKL